MVEMIQVLKSRETDASVHTGWRRETFTLIVGGRREKRGGMYEHAVGFRHLATYSHPFACRLSQFQRC
jgi:hypothetical protein